MKTIAEYRLFAEELKSLCERHGIGIVGGGDAVYGEITLFDMQSPSWPNDLKAMTFDVRHKEEGTEKECYCLDNDAAICRARMMEE